MWRDVKQMTIWSLADEKRKKKMTNQKGLSVINNLKQTQSRKSRCWTDEMYVSRSPNVNTGYTYYNYKIHTLLTM